VFKGKNLLGELEISLRGFIRDFDYPDFKYKNFPITGGGQVKIFIQYRNTRPNKLLEKDEVIITHITKNESKSSPKKGKKRSNTTVTRKKDMMIECNVCYEMREQDQYAAPTSTCHHDVDICNDCVKEYLNTQVTSTTANIKCIKYGCTEQFEGLVDFRGEKILFNRWNDIKYLDFLQKEPNFRWCSKPGCGNGVLTDEGYNYFICNKCNQQTCIFHRTKMHVGMTCKEYDEQVQEKDLLLISGLYKQCPACNRYIEKKEGCDHMKCVCGYEFCYRCLADFNQIRQHGNHKHNPTCSYYVFWEDPNEQ